jgi:hypothetical protein
MPPGYEGRLRSAPPWYERAATGTKIPCGYVCRCGAASTPTSAPASSRLETRHLVLWWRPRRLWPFASLVLWYRGISVPSAPPPVIATVGQVVLVDFEASRGERAADDDLLRGPILRRGVCELVDEARPDLEVELCNGVGRRGRFDPRRRECRALRWRAAARAAAGSRRGHAGDAARLPLPANGPAGGGGATTRLKPSHHTALPRYHSTWICPTWLGLAAAELAQLVDQPLDLHRRRRLPREAPLWVSSV